MANENCPTNDEQSAGLNRAAGFLRHELSPRLALKHLPELRFDWDAGGERAARIEELLREDGRDKDPR